MNLKINSMNTFTFRSNQPAKNSQPNGLLSDFASIFGVNRAKQILLLIALLFVSGGAWGAAKTWDGGGDGTNWSSANNWSPNGVPLSTDDVTISRNGSYAVVVNGNYSCSSLTLNYTGNTNGTISLTILGTNTLTVTNGISLRNAATNGGSNVLLDVSNGIVNCASISNTQSTSSTSDILIDIQDGTLNCSGNLTMGATADRNSLTFSGIGVLGVGGALSSNGTFTTGTGTVIYNGASQTIRSTTYNNLTLSGSGIKTFPAGTTTVNSILSMEGSATSSVTGTLNYIGTSTLQYKGTALQTTGSEFPATFSGTGGVVINNASGVNMSGSHTITNALTLTSGSFSIGANTLTLNGTIPTCGSLVGGASSNIIIGGSSANTNLPSVTLNNLTLNRANGVTLCGDVTVNGTLALTIGNLSLSNSNLTLGTSAVISGAPYSGTKMIETNGTGSLIKQSTTAAGFNITYPVGVGSLYNPMILSSMTATPVGTASVSVRAVTGHAINTSTTDLNKYWIISSSNLGLTSTNISLAYINPNDVSGAQSEYALRYSTTPADTWSIPNTPSGAGVNPLTTTASTVLDGTWTARESSVTWYSLRTGNWNDPTVWTLDPAGSLTNNPSNSYPQYAQDNVVVKNGRTVTMNLSNITCKNLTVEGTLDLASTSGHTFTTINGNGRIMLSSDSWPAGDATNFITAGQGEGTVVFYGSSNFSLITPRTFFNMEVMMSSANILTLMTDYTLNGNLEVKTGTFKINDDAATAIRTLIVKGNVDISAGANIRTGLGSTNGTYSISGTMPTSGNYHKIYHQFEIWGDFTNNGTVRFTNQSTNAPVYNQFTSTGAVSVWFKGLTNNVATCNGTTDFYNLIVDKGSDQTYTLELNASATANFALYGPNSVGRNESAPFTSLNPEVRKSLWIYNGTLKLTGDITIPTLSEGDNAGGNGDYAIGGNACLWIASANVSVYSTADNASQLPAGAVGLNTGSSNQALSVYGKYRISAGTFATRNSAGLIFWSTANAVVSIEGGTTTVSQFRSAASGTGQTSYLQSSGLLKVDAIGEVTNGFPLFGFDSSDGTFVMSGGEIQVLGESGNVNDVYLPISDGNYNVTGGKLTMSINGNVTLDYYSNVPFYNIDISRLNASNTAVVSLKTSLKVLNDFTLGNNSTITSNNLDLTVGGNFTTGATASTYTAGSNTTTFNGAKNTIISNSAPLTLNKVVINKSVHPTAGSYYEVSTSGAGQLAIGSDLTLILGSFNTKAASPNVAGNISIVDGFIANTTGTTVLTGGATQTLGGSGLSFGSLTLNNGNNGAQLLTDVVVNNLSFNAAGTAKVNVGVYNLKVTGSIANSGNSSRYIFGAGNASDGGLSLYVNANGAKTYPIGVSGKYTPAAMTVSGYSDDGYVTVIPVNASLATTNPTGGILMPYYWKINYNSFTTLPTVVYTFTYTEADNTGYYPGKVLDVSPYTRSYVNNTAKVDEGLNTIIFDTPFTLEKANYTAGATNRFTGTVVHYYSKGGDWASASTWDKNSKGSTTHEVPALGSIVHIYNDATGNGRVNCNAAISAANAPAEIIFEHDYILFPNHTSEEIPRLQLWVAGGYNLGRVTGTGMISFGASSITTTADFGDFGTNPDSYYMYFGGPATNLTGIPTPIPNLMFEYSTTINQALTVNSDFVIQGGATVSPLQNIDIKRDLAVGMWTGGTFQFMDATPAVTITVGRNIDFTNNPSGTLGTRIISCRNVLTTDVQHRLIVKGDIIHGSDNGSVFDLYNGATNLNRVVLELAGTGTNNYNRTSTAVPDFYQIVMNKGVDQTSSFTFNKNFTIYTAGNNTATKSITMQDGSLILNSAGFTNFNLTSGGSNFIIPSTSALVLTAGTYTANGASGIDLDGKLNLNGGSLDMSGGDNPIIIGASGASMLDVSVGTLTVGGQIRRGTNSEVGMLKYYQSGGSVYVGRNAASATTRGTLEVMGTGSVFSVSAGDLYIERASSATIPGLYLMPETTTLSSGNTIHIGSVAVGSQVVGVYSTPTLQNIEVLNGCTAKLLTVPLTLAGNLTITSGVFNANGLDLNIGGNFTNSGTFTHGNNTTTFNGTSDQAITGTTVFYKLTKTSTNTLTTNSAITVADDFLLSSGVLSDNGNTLSVKGDVTVNGVHQYTVGAGKGILLDATVLQNLYGNGTIGKLTINNSNGVDVPVGNLLTITNDLRLEAGVFNIDKNLLTLESACTITPGNAFSSSNMIQTNASFTDNGVTKILPSGASSFIYPVGAGGRYTPVEFSITSNGNSTGGITVKSAAEYHPTVIDPLNVLQYYWSVVADGMSNFTADATYKYESADVRVTGTNTEADYIAARLLSNGLGQWTKFDNTTVDETTNKIIFSYIGAGDAEINGDYTAGINEAIPATVPRYETSKDGDWTDVTVWSLIDPVSGLLGVPGVGIPVGGPRGSIATVKNVVTSAGNGISSYNTILEGPTGNLILGTTYGHRLGIVAGTGTLTCAVGDLPASDFTQFFAATGGTLEYNGSGSIDILTDLPIINNLKLSGTGTRRLPNIDIQLLGNLNIDGPIVDNDTYDKAISIKGNVTFDAGTFTAGNLASAKLIMNGASVQTISGLSSFTTTTNDLNHFEINNSLGVVLSTPVDVFRNLTLTSGYLTTTPTNILKMTAASGTATASSSSFVDGPMMKQMTAGGNFNFPIGKSGRLGTIDIVSVSQSGLWYAEYFNNSPNNQSLTTSNVTAPVAIVSQGEYWNILAPVAASAGIKLYWDASSGVDPSSSDMRGVQWVTNSWNEVALGTKTGTSAGGSAPTASDLTFNANAGGNYITFGSISIPAYTWTGAVNTDWFTAGNWAGGVPTGSANTTIASTTNKPVIAGSTVAQTNNLTLQSGATLTLNAGGKLTVNGNLVVTDANSLIVKNTPTSMASLITNGTISGATRIETTIPLGARYWYYGISVSGAGVTSGMWNASDAINTFAYRYASNAYSRFTDNVTPLNGVLNGYSVKLLGVGNVTLVSQGALNNGDLSASMSTNSWVLMSNPYPSYIDMSVAYTNNLSSFGSTKIGTTFYVPTNASGSTVQCSYNLATGVGQNGGTKIVAPNQGFWIKNYSTSAVQSFWLYQSSRLHATNVLKSLDVNSEPNDIFRIQLVGKTMNDEEVLVFRDGGVEMLSANDSEKRMNTGVESCNLYSFKSGTKVAINMLPQISSSYSVPLGCALGTAAAGDYYLSASNIESFDTSIDVFLEDVDAGVTYNLREMNQVPIVLGVGVLDTRFVLHFAPSANGLPTTLPKTDVETNSNQIMIQQLDEDVLVTIPGDIDKESRIELYGITGQLIRIKRGVEKSNRIALPDVKSAYIVKVINGTSVCSGKVVSR